MPVILFVEPSPARIDRMADDQLDTALFRFCEARRAGRSIDLAAAIGHPVDPSTSREFLERVRSALQQTRLLGSPALPGRAPPPESWPDIPGYDVVDLIGRGGMGVVYEGFQRATGQRVAIKMVRGDFDHSDSLAERLHREVELAARLHHPGVVRLLDAGVVGGGPFCVMEFVEGRMLDAAFVPGKCDPREGLRVLAEICDAVDYAHQRGVLHRDLKPGNILVDAHGRPHVLDFGLAKAIDPTTRALDHGMTLSEPGQILGTLGYMPPEQAAGRLEQISVRSDVYALGVMAYELLTGRLPIPLDGSLGDTLRRIEQVDASPPSTLRHGLGRDTDAVVLRAIEKVPERRYATVSDFAADLRRWIDRRPVLARRASWAARSWRLAQRNPAIASVTATAVLALTVLAGVAYFRIAHERDIAVEQSIRRGKTLDTTMEGFIPMFFEAERQLKGRLDAVGERRQHVENAMPYFEALARDAADAGIETRIGPILGRLGDVLNDQNDPRASEWYRRSLDILQRAAAESSGDQAVARELAFALARASRAGIDPQAAPDMLDRSVAIFAEIARAGGAESRRDLLQARMWRAYALARPPRSDRAAALDDLRSAVTEHLSLVPPGSDAAATIDLLHTLYEAARRASDDLDSDLCAVAWTHEGLRRSEQLVARYPDDSRVIRARLELLSMHGYIPRSYRNLGLAAADLTDEVWSDACEQAERLMIRHPADADMHTVANLILRLAGSHALRLGDTALALRRFRAQADAARRLYEADPTNAKFRRDYGDAIWNIAATCGRADDPEGRIAAFAQFLRLAESVPSTAAGFDVFSRAHALRAIGNARLASAPALANIDLCESLRLLDGAACSRRLSASELSLQAELRAAVEHPLSAAGDEQ